MDILSFALGMKLGKSQSGGGGTSGDERVKYVTFMNGDRELLKYPVISGDTCHDPVSKKYIDTPTKEPTVSIAYTHSGWSLTDGGSASSSALTNVIEDRTVYATFTESARKYTISFYDEDGTTLLDSSQWAYGTKPTFKTERDGYVLIGWSPELAVVTGDCTYTAVWAEGVSFADSSWKQIAEISESGLADVYFKVGDTRTIPFVYNETEYLMTFSIAGFNHDDLADGTGKAGISIISNELVPIVTRWDSNTYANSQPYSTSSLKTNADTIAKGCLPTDLQSVIKAVNKEYSTNGTSGAIQKGVTSCDVWVPSVAEIGYDFSKVGATADSYTKYIGALGSRYELFPFGSKTERKSIDTGELTTYWTRQAYRNGMGYICGYKSNYGTAAYRPYNISSLERYTYNNSSYTFHTHPYLIGFCI